MATFNVSIPKLNGNNYANWNVDIKYILMERGLWDIVNGREPKPETVSKEFKEYRTKSNTAISVIYLNIEAEYRKIIETCDDASEAWKVLKTHFCPDSRSQHMKLFTDLCDCRVKPGEAINLFSARILRIGDQIKSLDSAFSDVYLCFQLIRYLPETYDPVVQNILRLPKDKFIFKDIVSDLVAEESRLQLRELDRKGSGSRVEVQTVQRTNNPRDFICYGCGESGHYKRNCVNGRSRSFTKNPARYRRSSPSPKRSGQHGDRSRSRGRFQHKACNSYPKRTFQPKNSNYNSKNNLFNSFSFTGRKKSERVSAEFLVETSLSNLKGGSEWIFDSAASHHCCSDRELFVEYTPLRGEEMAVAIKGVTFPILGKGIIKLKFGQRILYFHNVMHAEKLRRNLISGPSLDTDGACYHCENGVINVYDGDQLLFRANLLNGTYRINFRIPRSNNNSVKFEKPSVSAVSKKENFELWHRRCAHVNPEIMLKTSKNNSVRGLPVLESKNFVCEACKLSKYRRKSFKSVGYIRSKNPLDLLYSDVWGPCETAGRNGEKYFLSIIDDYSRRVALYPIWRKSDVNDIVMRHIARAERCLNRKVKAFRSDNGGEFVNSVLDKFFDDRGIKHEVTNTFSPEQNGVVERFNQTVTDGARTLLNESGLETKFWPDAMLHFTYTWNRLVHRDLEKTPFELYEGFKPSIRHLKPFGSKAYVGVPRQKRSKLEAKAVKGILIGYSYRTRGYRVWLPDENRVIETINVSFEEKTSYDSGSKVGAVLGHDDLFSLSPIVKRDSDETVEYDIQSPSGISRKSSVDSEDNDDDARSKASESESECDEPVLDNARWVRVRKTRSDNSRTDIYYYKEGSKERLRSLEDIKKYCSRNGLIYNPNLFSFRGKDTFEGVVMLPAAFRIYLQQ